jgi:hypothetical protein
MLNFWLQNLHLQVADPLLLYSIILKVRLLRVIEHSRSQLVSAALTSTCNLPQIEADMVL